jgi:subfamily B ATP-binding cassette protein MsbA
MRKTISYFLPYMKNYKKEILFAVIGMIVVALASTASAHLIKPIVDGVFVGKDEEVLIVTPLMLIAIFSLKGIGTLLQSYFMVYVGEDIIRKIRDRLVNHLMYQDMQFLQSMRNGELISRVTSDITRIRRLISSIIPKLFLNILTILALTTYILYQNAYLAFYFLIIIPLLTVPMLILAKKMKRYSKRSQESNADMTSRLTETFNNIEVVKANHSQKYEIDRFQDESLKLFKYVMKQNLISQLSTPAGLIIGSFALALVLYLGGREILSGRMSAGEFGAFMGALSMLYDPIRKLSNIHTQMQDAVMAFERVDELLERDIKILNGSLSIDRADEVEFVDVSLRYGEKLALQNISLKAVKGKVYAFVGDSGAGKSSIVNLLVRFYEPSEGKILINGESIESYKLSELLNTIAYVPQRIFIFNDTIARNVAYSNSIDRERVMEALKKAFAWEFVKTLPDGIDTKLDEFGVNLSGGQRQRVALARALYKNPSLLILDEATSALDNRSERAIQEALEGLKDDLITFVVAHRLTTIESADRIFLFKDGKIVSHGNYQELMRKSLEFQKLTKRDYS